MDFPQILSDALPFIVSYVLQALGAGLPLIAANIFKLIQPPGVEVKGVARELAIKLAVVVFEQFSFIASILMSTVSSIALTLISPKKSSIAIVAMIFVILTALWAMRWQALARGAERENSKRRNEMTVAGFVAITLMMVVTIWARWP